MSGSDPVSAGAATKIETAPDENPARARMPTRPPPPMRVVTKGWWRLEEGEIAMEQLAKEDRVRIF